jgi:hypothetical protein
MAVLLKVKCFLKREILRRDRMAALFHLTAEEQKHFQIERQEEVLRT